MKKLKIGVIGAAGAVGLDHIKRLKCEIKHCRIVAVCDLYADKLKKIAEMCKAKAYADGFELINDPEVEAVLIASWDITHAQFIREAISLKKPVFCEQPLANNFDDLEDIIEMEMKAGQHLIQIGLMRRFDPAYLELKKILDSGRMGNPLLIHCKSRTRTTPPMHLSSRMHATNVVVHEIDVVRWLLGEEIDQVQVIIGRSSKYAPDGVDDPQLMIFQTQSGVVVDVEVSVNSRYGYDIECEVVCDNGTVSLAQPTAARIRLNEGNEMALQDSWRERFAEAYRKELQAWVDGAVDAEQDNPPSFNTWDGYIAGIVAEKLTEAMYSEMIEKVEMPDMPEFYQR